MFHSTRDSVSTLRHSGQNSFGHIKEGSHIRSSSFVQNSSSSSFPPVIVTKSASVDSNRVSSPSPSSSISCLQISNHDKLEYIKANMDLIPDVRDVPMHVGLPLPDDELESLLQLVGSIFEYDYRMTIINVY